MQAASCQGRMDKSNGTQTHGSSGAGGGGALWPWQGQKQSGKVSGFLEKVQQKDSFVQLVSVLALGVCFLYSPWGTIPSPPPPCVP